MNKRDILRRKEIEAYYTHQLPSELRDAKKWGGESPQGYARTGSYAQVGIKSQLREAWRIRSDRTNMATHTENGKRYQTAVPHHGGPRAKKPATRYVETLRRIVHTENTPWNEIDHTTERRISYKPPYVE
jgi:hypothetical protein